MDFKIFIICSIIFLFLSEISFSNNSSKEKSIIDWNNINKLKKENAIKLIGRKPIKIDWNELIKIDKKPIINIINKTNPKKSILKKQSIYKFSFKGIRDIEKDSFESIEILSNNWANSIN